MNRQRKPLKRSQRTSWGNDMRTGLGLLGFAVLGSMDYPLTLLGAVISLVIAVGDKIEW